MVQATPLESPADRSVADSAGVVLPLTLRAVFVELLDQPVRVVGEVRLGAGDQGQHGRRVRRRHRRALDGAVALVGREAAAGEREARDLERPVRRDAEVLPGRGAVGVGVREARRAAAVPHGQVELAGSTGRGDVDPRARSCCSRPAGPAARRRSAGAGPRSACTTKFVSFGRGRRARRRGRVHDVAGRRHVDDARDAARHLVQAEQVSRSRPRRTGRRQRAVGDDLAARR